MQARLTPICYEEGLHQGAANGCAEFINIATESYLKELLSDIFHRTRCNGETYIKTSGYKRRLEKQEAAWLKGTLQRNAAGLLPIEVEAAAQHQPLNLTDLRLALDLGNSYLSQLRLVSDRLIIGQQVQDEDEFDDGPVLPNGTAPLITNGTVLTNGVHDVEMSDEPPWGWSGGLLSDIDALGSVLDDCLAVGQ